MANRNNALDQPIIEAAKTEFLQHGFQDTSIHHIAKRAGVTTGAIYTRYQGKDELFHSLTEELLQALDRERKESEKAYKECGTEGKLDHFLSSMEKETARYIDILFEYYEECKLLLCCSKGSSVESMFNEMMKHKISETKTFLQKNISAKIGKLTLDLVELLMNQQFSAYTLIIEKGYGKEETVEYIKMWGDVAGAGWAKIFKDLLRADETDGKNR